MGETYIAPFVTHLVRCFSENQYSADGYGHGQTNNWSRARNPTPSVCMTNGTPWLSVYGQYEPCHLHAVFISFSHIVSIMGLLAKGGEGLKIVDDIFTSVLFKAPLDVFISSVWSIGPGMGPRTSIDMLRAVSE